MHRPSRASPLPRLFRLARAGILRLGQRYAKLLRDVANGFGESDVLQLLHEAEHVTGNAAAEAVEELARGVDGKRRRLFLVEGAQAGIILRPGFFQLHVLADDADDVSLLLDRGREIAGS
jgi:hypothetical protein